ncbi:hypothetical protein P4H67_25085 [Paenibacillus lautus]|uniref:hypothetical protein n=1 Tax=Paenibacillus lautus TaxID=1401 RepID=UPI002DB85D91|nr:hypothetical protein [Paenibacillus lautus]MEC0310031.1 hypothetical protein [Paenibacillus lautus]
MKVKKLFIASMIALSTLSISSYAADVEVISPNESSTSGEHNNHSSGAEIIPFGNNIPTSLWNIRTSGYYTAEFSRVRDYTYTNYYFPTNSNGEIFVRGRVWELTGMPEEGHYYKIICYDATTNKAVTEYYSSTSGYGTDVNVRFYNLDTSRNYYFKIESLSWSEMGGSLRITHN